MKCFNCENETIKSIEAWCNVFTCEKCGCFSKHIEPDAMAGESDIVIVNYDKNGKEVSNSLGFQNG